MKRGTKKTQSAEPEEAAGTGAGAERLLPPRLLPPRLGSYLLLILAVWVFLAIQTWLAALMLGSSRGVILLGLFLAAGFMVCALFDWFWTRRDRES